MEDEVIIIEVQPKMCDINTFDCEPGHFAVRTNFERELYAVNQLVADRSFWLYETPTCQVELLYRIEKDPCRIIKFGTHPSKSC